MNKNNTSEMDEVLSVIGGSAGSAGLRQELLALIGSCLRHGNPRSYSYMIHYYGLSGAPGMTLEAIGATIAGGLTRERVRQIIDGALASLLKAEGSDGPYKKTRERFSAMLEASGRNFLAMESLSDDGYFQGFGEDPKGLIAFLNDAGIRQVVYRGVHYIYPKSLGRQEAIELVQVENKRARRAATMEKMETMAKTVTYVPQEARAKLLEEAAARDMPLNRLYERILEVFISKPPCSTSKEFEKTQSWRARKGKAEWSQVGIYIDKGIFEKVRDAAAAVRPEPISNMSYISQAFVCFAQGKVDV